MKEKEKTESRPKIKRLMAEEIQNRRIPAKEAPPTQKQTAAPSRRAEYNRRIPSGELDFYTKKTMPGERPVSRPPENQRMAGRMIESAPQMPGRNAANHASRPVSRPAQSQFSGEPRRSLERRNFPAAPGRKQAVVPPKMRREAGQNEDLFAQMEAPYQPTPVLPALERQKTGGKTGGDKAAFAHDKTLKFRHELKFYISYAEYLKLRQALKALMEADENAGKAGCYHIRSLYFDDRDETAVREKMAGTEKRAKFRIRIYNFQDAVIRLEKKIKEGQYIAKKSMPLSKKECRALLSGNFAFLLRRKEPLAKEFFLEMRMKQLRPKVFVDYKREAYVLPFERVRITFDMDLKTGRYPGDLFDAELPVVPIFEPGKMILEVKFNKYLPDYIRQVLTGAGAFCRTSASKYILCRQFD